MSTIAIAPAPVETTERRRALLETALVMGAFHAYIYFGRPSFAADLGVLGGLTVAVFAIFARRGETAASVAYLGDVRRAARLLWPFALASVLGATALRLAFGPVRPMEVFPGIFLALLAYPVWGFVQQLFYVGFMYRGLVRGGLSEPSAIAASGLAFGLIHAPNWLLVAATLPLGLVCAWAYRRAPSILVLGLLHGIGGALAMKVLGMDLEIGAGFVRPH